MKNPLFITVIVLAFCLAAFAQTPDPDCPKISVSGPNYAPQPGESIPFSAEVTKEVEKYNVEYIWSASGGKITSGQGTKSVQVTWESKESFTVTLTVKGLPEKCPKTASETGSIAAEFGSVLTDRFGPFGRSGTKGRIDNFIDELLKYKDSEGIIVFYDDKYVLKNVKFLHFYLTLRKFPHARITLVISDKEDQLVEFWRVPLGGHLEEWEDNLIIKLEEFEKLQKLFTPKPIKTKPKK